MIATFLAIFWLAIGIASQETGDNNLYTISLVNSTIWCAAAWLKRQGDKR